MVFVLDIEDKLKVENEFLENFKNSQNKPKEDKKITKEKKENMKKNKEGNVGKANVVIKPKESKPIDESEENKKKTNEKKQLSNRGGTLRNKVSHEIPKKTDTVNQPKVEKKKTQKPLKEITTLAKNGIKMPQEHQQFLKDKCNQKGLDFKKVMALISLESSFDSNNISSSNDYGYMQINKVNHNNLTKTLGTKNAPLDPYVNITWGTHMLGDLYSQWRSQGIDNTVPEGQIFSQLDKYVMSSYNKGVNGFKKHGMATKYINLIEDRYKQMF